MQWVLILPFCWLLAAELTSAADPTFDKRHEEFSALAQHHLTECDPSIPSSQWSCYRCISRADFDARDASGLYGFSAAEGKIAHQPVGKQVDTGYTSQIPYIVKLTEPGPGYLRMNMTATLKKVLLGFYKGNKHLVKPTEVVGGPYTNSHSFPFGFLSLDNYRTVHAAVMREMKEVLQWWTNQSLQHTATYGIRVYPRDSMLINHVDREDTHLASAVLQVDQTVDPDGGWPLEVLQPDGLPCEVYLQPGEMVLYEGARIKHGRPLRFNGDAFANVFSHFRPDNWHGTSDARKKAAIERADKQKAEAENLASSVRDAL